MPQRDADTETETETLGHRLRRCISHLRDWFVNVLGDVKVFRWPFWLVYDPGSYRVKGAEAREVMGRVRPGDILVRGYDSYLDGKLIPGTFSHVGLYLGETTEADLELAPTEHRDKLVLGPQTVIHAIAEGVLTQDVLDFCRCDRMVVLRFPQVLQANPRAPADDPAGITGRTAIAEHAIRQRLLREDVPFAQAWPVVRATALAQLGRRYDFGFDFKDSRRLSCTELVHRATRCLAPFLGIQPTPHRILFLSGEGITPDAFVSAPLSLEWASRSVPRSAIDGLRAAEQEEAA